MDLGPYEAAARDVIFGTIPLADMSAYELMIARYRSATIRPERFYTSPVRVRPDGLNGWGFALSGFKFMAKLDRRPFPTILQPALVNGSSALMGTFVNYEGTVEHAAAFDMARAERLRLAKRRMR